LPPEAVASIKSDPTSLKALAGYLGVATGAGALLGGGEEGAAFREAPHDTLASMKEIAGTVKSPSEFEGLMDVLEQNLGKNHPETNAILKSTPLAKANPGLDIILGATSPEGDAKGKISVAAKGRAFVPIGMSPLYRYQRKR
jgi:hypothetical protein